MKPFWGIDLTEDEQNTKYNAERFAVSTTSPLHKKELDDAMHNLIKSSASTRPGWILAFIVLCWAVLIAAILLKVTGVLGKFPLVAVIVCVVMVAILVLRTVLRIRLQKPKDSTTPRKKAAQEQFDRAIELIHNDLGVPENATDVDVMEFAYTVRDGELCPDDQFYENIYCALSVKMFRKGDKLCFADTSHLYSLDISELKGIRTVKETVTMENWDKDIACNEGISAQYGMIYAGDGNFTIPHYHILEFENDGETWGLYFPCYELPTFRELTGFEAE